MPNLEYSERISFFRQFELPLCSCLQVTSSVWHKNFEESSSVEYEEAQPPSFQEAF
jgi:hypothetical protein